jgi:hypothetical protein
MEQINLEELSTVIGGAVDPNQQSGGQQQGANLDGGSMYRNVSTPGSTYGTDGLTRQMVVPGSPGFHLLPNIRQ